MLPRHYWQSLAQPLCAALFGLIALRASGLGFLMITLALSQVLWGLAYRWVSVTNGDNGMTGLTHPNRLAFPSTAPRPSIGSP